MTLCLEMSQFSTKLFIFSITINESAIFLLITYSYSRNIRTVMEIYSQRFVFGDYLSNVVDDFELKRDKKNGESL